MMFGKPQHEPAQGRREPRSSSSGPLLARLGLGAVVLAALGIAVTLALGALDQNIAQVRSPAASSASRPSKWSRR